jgi:hypothetical protein
MFRQFRNELVMAFFDMGRIMRMNSHTGVNPIMSLGDWNSTTHIIRPGPVTDRQNSADAGVPGSLENGVPVRIKSRIVEMSMRVNQHGLYFSAKD